jgi:hypothetical protein
VFEEDDSMRDFLKSTGRWLRAACFWPLVLLALPNCTLDFDSVGPQPEELFDPGPSPASSAIMCEIPLRDLERVGECATQQDVDEGISFSEAATALAEGRSNPVALDWRPDALAACGGMPMRKQFEGTFPDGLTVCLNCGTQIPAVYASPTDACIAKCKDLNSVEGEGTPETDAFCEANARTAVNYDQNICYDGACTAGGNPDLAFFDPRKHQEKVVWIDASPGILIFGADNNSLQRTAPTTGPGEIDFNEGAGSAQTIVEGDGWVEFAALQNGVSHVIGLRESCEDPISCPDTDFGLGGIGFAISLNNDDNVYVIESGSPLVVAGPFGNTYTPGERFRVRATDNHDGTATISYSRLTAACVEGTVCAEDVFHTHVGPSPSYPLRVDATFREVNATLENVTLVRKK